MCLEVKGEGEGRTAKILSSISSDADQCKKCLQSGGGAPIICIRGTRGIGKTYQLLELGKLLSTGQRGETLYVNLNHFYFSNHSLYHFAREFSESGGRVLLLDQIFKYPGWAEELITCHKDFPRLRIVFTASSVMTLEEEYPQLKGLVEICDLYGFSFREYLNEQYGLHFPKVTLDELLSKHREIASRVKEKLDPMDAFPRYLRRGYYPHSGDETLFGENLVKNMNMLLEVDLVYIRQIAPTYLPKLRKLLYLVGEQHDGITNVSSLSEAIDTSRATVMNYLKYLSDARLIRMIYKEGNEYPRKPDRVFINDTNILKVMRDSDIDMSLTGKTFFLSTVQDAGIEVHLSEDAGVDFILNHSIPVRCLCKGGRRRSISPDTVNALCTESTGGDARDIPVWLFGFLH